MISQLEYILIFLGVKMAEEDKKNFEKVLRELENAALKEESERKANRLEKRILASQGERLAEVKLYYKDPMIDKATRWERARQMAERHWSEGQMGFETWLATMGQILALSNLVRDAIHYSTLNPENFNPQSKVAKFFHAILFMGQLLKQLPNEKEKRYHNEMEKFLQIARQYNHLPEHERTEALKDVKIDWFSLADSVKISNDSKLEVKELQLPSGKPFPEKINQILKSAVIEWLKSEGYECDKNDVVYEKSDDEFTGPLLTKEIFEEQLREKFKASLIGHKTPLDANDRLNSPGDDGVRPQP